MCSFRESKMLRLLEPSQYREMMHFTREQLIRVYPEGSRVSSSNYHPMHMWNCGAQMVALNYQTKDKSMQLNHAKFQENGNCGYVLMPAYMNSEHFDPHERPPDLEPFSPVILTVKVAQSFYLSISSCFTFTFFCICSNLDHLRQEPEKEH